MNIDTYVLRPSIDLRGVNLCRKTRVYEVDNICPFCHHVSHFNSIISVEHGSRGATITLCPNCNRFIFLESGVNASGQFVFARLYPTPQRFVASSRIQELSPKFVTIYEQVLSAKNASLTDLVGVGIRKAAEQLVTDYLVHIGLTPHKTFSGRINQLDSQDTQIVSSVIRSLGNDEAHALFQSGLFNIDDALSAIEYLVSFVDTKLAIAQFQQKLSERKASPDD